MAEPTIPVVDFSSCALSNVLDLESKEVKETVDLIAEALEQKGCVYLTNHGIDAADLQTLRATALAFFNLPVEEKVKCLRKRTGGGTGWIGLGMELLGNKKGDLKESYEINLGKIDTFPWPSDELVPGFRDVNRNFMKKLNMLSRRLFQLLGKTYSPKDPKVFIRAHKDIETAKNTGSCMRSIYYPPISNCEDVQPGQMRCGSHTDFGSFTFLLQDMSGGLEALRPDGEWIEVTPLDGAILLLPGDMLEIWTAGRIKATVHRVRNPTGDKMNQARECTAHFIVPDDDFLVECLDGSDKYSPTNPVQHFNASVYAIQTTDEENRDKMLKEK